MMHSLKYCTLHTGLVKADTVRSIALYAKTESSVFYISVKISAFTKYAVSVLPTCTMRGKRHSRVLSVAVTDVSNGS